MKRGGCERCCARAVSRTGPRNSTKHPDHHRLPRQQRPQFNTRGDLEDVIPMAARMIEQMKGSNPVGPHLIHPAHLEQEILLGFVDLTTADPEVLHAGNRSRHLDVQCSGKKGLSRGGGEDLGVSGHALSKVANAIDEMTLNLKH